MPPFRSIDHVMLRLPAAEPLFELFSRTFGLPVAWPLQRTGFATYGWVHVGNTDLEFWAAADNGDLPACARPPLVHGFALEPSGPLPGAMAHAISLGIACKPARPFQSAGHRGEVVTNFTNSVLLDLSAPSCCVFFCEWAPGAPIYPWDDATTPVERRMRHRQVLEASGGGPLGLLGLHAVRMGTPDLAAHRRHWQALSGSSPGGHSIALTPEVSLELVPGEHLRIELLSFRVRSLAVARTFLAHHQLLGAGTEDGQLGVACEGLHIHLVEAPAPPGVRGCGCGCGSP